MMSDIRQDTRIHEGPPGDVRIRDGGFADIPRISPPGKGISARLHKAYPRRSIRYPPWNIRGLTLFDYVRTYEGYPSTYIQRIAVTVYPKDIRGIPSPDFAHIGMRTHEHTRVCSCIRHFLVFLTIHEIHTIMFHIIC